MKRLGALLVTGVMVSAPAWASVGPAPGERREPPQAAFDACKGKSEGAAVEIVTPNGGTIKATCKTFKGQLAAVPEGAPPPPPQN
ncbi:hypothetical protein F6V25_15000 [Oryzomonas japonica]|uniref:Uncharacterized protein n=2 Tax=Oryzomonas japonica TaxID=2603858 RepID=A0A7J4ZN10_9BACT|nr:hypothetical protein F6V25_15000 [Oryzomonas japonica]